MKIEDKFLDQKKFNKLQNYIINDKFNWNYNNRIDTGDDVDKYQLVHIFYINYVPTSPSIEIIAPLIKKIDPITLGKIKANLLTRTPNIIENTFHVDGDATYDEEKLKQLTTSILYVNTNNGYTKFEDGTKVESVANKMVTFPTNMKHTGTSCTDERTRVVINFNYFK